MNWFERFIYLTQAEMNEPKPFGIVHFAFIFLTVLSSVHLCLHYRNATEQVMKRILLIAWVVVALLEVHKQILVSFTYSDGVAVWSYSWSDFPFQLCSSQLYLLPLAVFLKDGKLRDGVLAYLASVSLLGGVAVYAVPSTVFSETVFINVQTMIHHGLQIALGVYIAVYNRRKIDKRFALAGAAVFGVMLSMAITLNLLAPLVTEESFNMFYISPYFQDDIPVLTEVLVLIPYPILLVGYCVVILSGSFLLLYGARKCVELWQNRSKKEEIAVSEETECFDNKGE